MPLDINRLRASRPENEIHYYPSIGSTMTAAAEVAGQGAPDRTVVIADEQTAGVGRLGRAWHSEAETGIYCSILLKLDLPAGEVPVATLLLGLAAADAIQRLTMLICDLRWPNDVLVSEKKVAGILTQLVGDTVIAGIGINVNQSSLPRGLRSPASSLALESGGKPYSREDLLIQLLQSIDSYRLLMQQSGRSAIVRAFTAASSYVLDRRVIIEETGRRGTTAGLDENGFLLVQYESGQLDRVASGGVRPDV